MGVMGSSHMCFERRWRRTLPSAHSGLPTLARMYGSFHPFSDSFHATDRSAQRFFPFQSRLEQRLKDPQDSTKQKEPRGYGKNRRGKISRSKDVCVHYSSSSSSSSCNPCRLDSSCQREWFAPTTAGKMGHECGLTH